MSDLVKITFQPPDKKQRGYLRRQKKAMQFQRELAKPNPEPEALDLMVEFLADYVTEPAERDAAIAAIWEASEEQWNDMMAALRGTFEGDAAAVPPT